MEWVLSFITVEKILAFLARRAKIAGALFLLKFQELAANNTALAARLRQKQESVKDKQLSGSQKAEIVVYAVLEDLGETGNDALRALLFAINGAVFYESQFGMAVTQVLGEQAGQDVAEAIKK